ncbi:unnamed protein product [Prunus brigantina]
MFALVQLGPKVEDVRKPVNPLVFLFRLSLGAMAGAYYVLVPIYLLYVSFFVKACYMAQSWCIIVIRLAACS